MPRLAAEVVAVKACGINGLLPAAFVGGPLPFIPRFALTAPPSAARRPYNSSLENFWGEGLPINMPEDPEKGALRGYLWVSDIPFLRVEVENKAMD